MTELLWAMWLEGAYSLQQNPYAFDSNNRISHMRQLWFNLAEIDLDSI